MAITEAIKEAQKTTGTIERKDNPELVFQPTDGPECTKIFILEEPNNFKFLSNCWNPQLQDLLATDWIVGKPVESNKYHTATQKEIDQLSKATKK